MIALKKAHSDNNSNSNRVNDNSKLRYSSRGTGNKHGC